MHKRAYIGGTFDCLHRGHLALFAAARRIAIQTVVSVNTDAFAERYKRRPLMPLADRLSVLENCKLVDLAIVNVGDENSRVAIVHSGADCIVHGSDWAGESLMSQMGISQEWLDEHRIALAILPYTPWTSTTELLKAYDARKVAA